MSEQDIASEIDRQKLDKAVHFLLLLLSTPALMTLAGCYSGPDETREHAGRHDADAALKTRLTGVPLDPAILTIDFYR